MSERQSVHATVRRLGTAAELITAAAHIYWPDGAKLQDVLAAAEDAHQQAVDQVLHMWGRADVAGGKQ